jgi:putative flippase GtrA
MNRSVDVPESVERQPSESKPRSAFSSVRSNTAIRYLIAGGLSFIVDFGLLAVLHDLVGLPVWLATGIAFLVSFAFTYTIQRVFSFESRAPHGRALVKYTILVAFNTLATVAIVSLLNGTALSWGGGKVVATVVTTCWNYFVYKYWVFAERTPVRSPAAPAEGNTSV